MTNELAAENASATVTLAECGAISAVHIDGASKTRLHLADGRSWPHDEVECVTDGAGTAKRVILIATGEVLWPAPMP